MSSVTVLMIGGAVVGGLLVMDAVGRVMRSCRLMLEEYDRTLREARRAQRAAAAKAEAEAAEYGETQKAE